MRMHKAVAIMAWLGLGMSAMAQGGATVDAEAIPDQATLEQWTSPGAPAERVEVTTNVVYGETEGVGLVMDVLRPVGNANGQAVIFIVSGGLVSNRDLARVVTPGMHELARTSGTTFFLVMHGAQPRWTADEVMPQLARAVRFIRHNAGQFGIRPDAIGVVGMSSGGWMTLIRATMGDDGNQEANDPVEREPSRVQAAVAICPPTDFLNYGTTGTLDMGTGTLKQFRRAFFHYDEPREGEAEMGKLISPVTHVSTDDAPTLLIHGDADDLVPIQQSLLFDAAMDAAGAPCLLITRPGAGHGWPDMEPDFKAMMGWFDHYLGE